MDSIEGLERIKKTGETLANRKWKKGNFLKFKKKKLFGYYEKWGYVFEYLILDWEIGRNIEELGDEWDISKHTTKGKKILPGNVYEEMKEKHEKEESKEANREKESAEKAPAGS